jgi:hypothetical protein
MKVIALQETDIELILCLLNYWMMEHRMKPYGNLDIEINMGDHQFKSTSMNHILLTLMFYRTLLLNLPMFSLHHQVKNIT